MYLYVYLSLVLPPLTACPCHVVLVMLLCDDGILRAEARGRKQG